MSNHTKTAAGRVGVREFKARATALINEAKPLIIEKHGKPVGFYLPLAQKDRAKAREAADRLEATIASILERTGMTRDEFEAAWEDAGRD